jgi:ABC-type sugar transport system, periplasmic component
MKKRNLFVGLSLVALGLVFNMWGNAATAADAKKWNPNDEYYLITFQSGLEFWQECFEGFKDAASVYGAKVYYTGSETNDISKQVSVIEQVAAKNPAGLAITCADSEGLTDTINAVMAQGIDVVLFDNDSPRSNRYAVIQANNYSAGEYAAKTMAKLLGEKGECAVLYGVGIPSSTDRAMGFIDYIKAHYPNMSVVATGNSVGDETEAAQIAAGIVQANPKLAGFYGTNSPRTVGIATAVKEADLQDQISILGFDTDESVFKLIDDGVVAGTVKQGAYHMGYWSFEFLFHTANNFVHPIDNWRSNKINPLPIYVDAGTIVITKENIDMFR